METLRSIKLPTTLTFIGSSFEGCSNLTNVNLPDGLYTISYDAFSGCTNLTDINLPNGFGISGNNAFLGSGLSGSVVLPSSLSALGDRVFYGCDALESITIKSDLASDNLRTESLHGIINLNNLYIDDESLSEDVLSTSYFCFNTFNPLPSNLFLKTTLDCSVEDNVNVYFNGSATYKYKGTINGYSKLEYVNE